MVQEVSVVAGWRGRALIRGRWRGEVTCRTAVNHRGVLREKRRCGGVRSQRQTLEAVEEAATTWCLTTRDRRNAHR